MAAALPEIRRAGAWTVGELLSAQARRVPERVALDDGAKTLTYRTLDERANRLANALAALGVGRGARVAILSENRTEYLEATYAAAKLGAVLCALNWRLAREELAHCVRLVEPTVVLLSPRFEAAYAALGALDGVPGGTILLGDDYERRLQAAAATPPPLCAEPEDGLLILYTSGTTGLPKGALISHRAELARMDVSRIDLGLQAGDGFVAWAPMFHMVSLEHALHVLGLGGTVFVVDGADIPHIVRLVATQPQWWLVLIPGMIERLVEALREGGVRPRGIRLAGALADLVPGQLVAEASRLLQAPYLNTFGSTETGMLPGCGRSFPVGTEPDSLAKDHNSLYLWRLVDRDDRDVAPGEPGEIAVRGPTVFSGYWNADAVNAREFRGGWFHMGDMFVERPDGRIDFVDRAKYLIKSGGENIYPIEIERVLMRDARVAEAVVVRRRSVEWGEVPVAFVAVHDRTVTPDDLMRACRAQLSSYKLPREIRIVASQEDFPRSTSGKVQRQLVERWLDEGSA
ncbi:MAG TPA: class I adenylate-forming enzyme family protein [Quisquiliibacterium sp.]|nr:class I adenylate-forming enzyme family protein [Quisquiliibacterium sp.]